MLLPRSLIEQAPDHSDFHDRAGEIMGRGEIVLTLEVSMNVLKRVCARLYAGECR